MKNLQAENKVTTYKMAEEQQVMKEPQQVTMKEPQQVTTKEPQQVQQVTTKNPNKVKVGKRLAEYNHRKREEKKAQSKASRGVNQYYGIGAVIAVGVIGGLGYYIYRTKKGQTSGEVPNSPAPQNPSKPLPQSNKFVMD